MFLGKTDPEADKPLLLRAVESLVAGPQDITRVVDECTEKVTAAHKDAPLSEEDFKVKVADTIIERYARTCGRVGGLTAAAGAIPGLATLVSLVGAAAADLAITMKFQIEMTMALAHLFGRDISAEQEQQLCYAIAGLGVATQAGLLSFERFTIKSIQEAARRLLKTRARRWLIDLFKRLGLRLTQRGVLKAIPLGVGVVFSYTTNRKLTRYIGRRARDYFLSTDAR